MAHFQKKEVQIINASIEEVWDFISSPNNLKKITPEYMGFDITSAELPEKMYPGMIITYKLSPLPGIKINWMTEITHVKELSYFVDEQRMGPYTMWHHEHHLEKTEDGQVKMTDLITYITPLGFLGAFANEILIKGELKKIFDFRRAAIDNYFGKRN